MAHELKVGGLYKITYNITHFRKGTFYATLVADHGKWVDVKIVEGSTKCPLPENDRHEGEQSRVRKSFCVFKEVTAE